MFKLHPNHRIVITQGDSAELDMRLFNKDSLPKYEPKMPRFELKGLWPFKGKFTGNHVYNSEGIMLEDSEGNPIDSEGNYIYPEYPFWPIDSEGHWMPIMPKAPQWFPHMKLPSGFHQLQEEPIRYGDIIILKVRDFQGNIVLEKQNDEFRNTIFFDKEDTQYLEPGLYTWQLSYITDKDTDTEEEQTIVDEAFFEVLKKYTVSEN